MKRVLWFVFDVLVAVFSLAFALAFGAAIGMWLCLQHWLYVTS